jgi:hypothetical protein
MRGDKCFPSVAEQRKMSNRAFGINYLSWQINDNDDFLIPRIFSFQLYLFGFVYVVKILS